MTKLLLSSSPQVLYNFFFLCSPMLASVSSKNLLRKELRPSYCWQRLLMSSCEPSSEAFVGTIGSQPSLLKGMAGSTIPCTSQDNWIPILAVVPALPSYCVCHLCRCSAFSPYCDLALMHRGTATAKPHGPGVPAHVYILLTLALKSLH